jgi:DNA-directed DNA polymerase III PolC
MYLNCKTYFSFQYGTFGTEELVKAAAALGITTMALTNINNTCDLWDFVDFCRLNNIKPIAGTEIRNDHVFLYLLLAKNNRGLLSIHRFLSGYLQEKTDFPQRPPFNKDVYVIYPLSAIQPQHLKVNELIGVQMTEVNKLYNVNVTVWADKFVIRHPVTIQNKTYYNVHRLLRAIDKNIIGSKLQLADVAGEHESFISPLQLLESFKQYPDIVTNTCKVMDSCSVDMDFRTDKTRKVFSGSAEEDKNLLAKLAWEGMQLRYGSENENAKARVTKELKIIDQLGFNAYFLITWDMIKYAQSREFYYVGRGSGANSIVAYCLQITDVDPIELDLYFERFLNPFRSVPPDFDIDFSWKDRNEMIAYMFKRYGKEHVCLLGSYTTFQSKAIIRELGKVYGLPKEEIDHLGERSMNEDKIQKQIGKYGSLIKNFPHHLSIHAGGILISDEPIHQYTATELPPKNFSTSQIDMFIAEKIGLFKLDMLSQRGLGHIKETIELVRKNKRININIHDVENFKKDKRLAQQIRKADTIGCFYIESPGMRQLLKKLECDDYVTLVAASSIIRPGVAQSGMMRQYIYRYHHPNDFEYLHPKMKELLQETYGVMVYQEDVIKVAHHFAGLDMAEADILRRAMSGKYRGHKQFEAIKAKFFLNCRKKSYPDSIAAEVWRQIESFGGYSFSKAHSASFAVESYQSLFLKAYYPMEFMVAVINNFGGFYSREVYFHELKKTGAHLHLPCVNKSDYLTSITGCDVYMGFIHLEGLEANFATAICQDRIDYGPYQHLQDFIERLKPGIEQINILIRIGALRFTGKTKKELLWEANFLQQRNNRHSVTNVLFKEKPIDFKLPALQQHPLDDAIDEIEQLGFPLCNVFELVNEDPGKYVRANELQNYLGKEVSVLGYLIVVKTTHTVHQETMFFCTFIDADGDWLDTVHFPPIVKKFPLTGKGFYRMKGKIVEEFGVYSVEVNYCTKVGYKGRTGHANLLHKYREELS